MIHSNCIAVVTVISSTPPKSFTVENNNSLGIALFLHLVAGETQKQVGILVSNI
jgi:hypothetical protein